MKSTIRNMMLAGYTVFLFSCGSNQTENKSANADNVTDSSAVLQAENSIGNLLDSLNSAAARADFDIYFSYYAEDAVFMGTDATEHWNKQAFMDFARPYFERGRAWNFTALERNIYVDASGKIAWFDELLETQMQICRGSGVVSREGEDWKIRQYVLSMTVPNSQVDSIVAIKAAVETLLMDSLKRQ